MNIAVDRSFVFIVVFAIVNTVPSCNVTSDLKKGTIQIFTDITRLSIAVVFTQFYFIPLPEERCPLIIYYFKPSAKRLASVVKPSENRQ